MSGAAGSGGAPVRVILNGQPLAPAGVSAFDRGLHYGDGLFETISCLNGRARFLSLHLERLGTGCERLRIRLDGIDAIRSEVQQLAAESPRSIVKVIVTRGEATSRGYGASGTETATRLVFQYPWPAENPESAREGVQVQIARLRYGENERLAGLKHLNRLEQVLARSELPAESAAELLVFSSSGHLASGTMSNVFLVQGGRVRTPRLDKCGVAGIMRRVVLREAVADGLDAEACELTAGDVEGASEIFLTNSRIGIWPVRALDGRRLDVGPVTRRLQARLASRLEEPADA